jgi:hypothetical protein
VSVEEWEGFKIFIMNRRIGKIEDYLLPAGLLVGGYFILKNFGLFGSTENASNNTSIDTSTATADAQSLAQVNATGVNQTLSSAQITSLAADIYNQAVAGNQDQIVADIGQLQNIADMYALKVAYGTKQLAASAFSTCALFGFDCQSMDLDSTINQTLDAAHLQTANNYLSSVGINYVI